MRETKAIANKFTLVVLLPTMGVAPSQAGAYGQEEKCSHGDISLSVILKHISIIVFIINSLMFNVFVVVYENYVFIS
jgi:hypothetical protein